MALEYLAIPYSNEAVKGDSGLWPKSTGKRWDSLNINKDNGSGFKYIKYVNHWVHDTTMKYIQLVLFGGCWESSSLKSGLSKGREEQYCPAFPSQTVPVQNAWPHSDWKRFSLWTFSNIWMYKEASELRIWALSIGSCLCHKNRAYQILHTSWSKTLYHLWNCFVQKFKLKSNKFTGEDRRTC